MRQDGIAIAVEIFSQWMLGDMHRQVEQFDILNDPELIGLGEAPIAFHGGTRRFPKCEIS